jgi:Putative zinc-finger
MSRLGRAVRRPDQWASPHERARSRAAERIDGQLEPTEAAWLENHLATCDACFDTAVAYETDRLALRALRDDPPQPPRDLWARTSAAIEHEAPGHRRPSTAVVRQGPLAQWGAVAGIVVVALVVGSSVLSGGWLTSPSGTTNGIDGSITALITPPPGPSGVAVGPGATPMAVDAGAVGWFDVGADGSYAYNVANVDEVCAEVDEASCAALDRSAAQRIALTTPPKSVITSPSGQAVVVGSDGSGGNQVTVMALPDASGPSASAAPTRTPKPTPTPVAASPSITPEPVTTPSSPPSSETPSPSPTAVTTPAPTLTPGPTAEALAIVSGVTIVGDAAAFSLDGTWFAFTARPADGSDGPDIYVWRVGDARAKALTTDHRSAFASWSDGLVVGSRPGLPPSDPSVAPGDASSAAPTAALDPVSFTIDPATGAETTLAIRAWRPVVDPTGAHAVVWDGSVAVTDDGSSITPAKGRLELVDWTKNGSGTIDPKGPVVRKGPVGDFSVRWDETGSWLAVWVADANNPAVGRLSLLHLDPATGAIDRPKAGPQDVPALAGFSIENGRLAWATPPSQDGEGSRVHIVAWSADGVGSIETAPGQDVVLVR